MAGPLVAIVGPTASGKTALAIELAEMFDGEIICADSRTVYKGMDIGTAKPTVQERSRVKHHLLDVVTPDKDFNVADFKALATEAIGGIIAARKLPILVGGSGLYVDSVLFDYKFSASGSARDPRNPRHLAKGLGQHQGGLRARTLVVGINIDRSLLKLRIEARAESMIEAGLIEEVRRLHQTYPDSKALLAPGYQAFISYLNGDIDLGPAKERLVRSEMQLAKRQLTWFRRNKGIHWLAERGDVVELVTTFLSNQN